MAKLDFWIRMLDEGEVVPPFCIELVLKSGEHFFVHSGGFDEEESNDLTLKVWDMRAFGPNELDALRLKLNEVRDRSELSHPEKIHPKLDWAILRAHLSDVMYCVEWHDRLWPQEDRAPLGFVDHSKRKGDSNSG